MLNIHHWDELIIALLVFKKKTFDQLLHGRKDGIYQTGNQKIQIQKDRQHKDLKQNR